MLSGTTTSVPASSSNTTVRTSITLLVQRVQRHHHSRRTRLLDVRPRGEQRRCNGQQAMTRRLKQRRLAGVKVLLPGVWQCNPPQGAPS